MTAGTTGRRLRVLELRSVRGTGGGPEKTILLGAAQRDRDRVDVVVCYLRDRRDDVFGLDRRAGALDVDYVEVLERHSLDWRVWPALRALVRDRRIDIVHAHDYKTDLLALLLARRAGVIPLSTAHGWTGQSWRERALYYPADKRLLARFPRVIAVSSDIAAELARHGVRRERTIVILNAIDPDLFRPDPAVRQATRAALGFGPDVVAIGAVGRLERQKRFDLLLDACAPLLAARPDLRLAIAGDGSLRGPLEAHAGALGMARQCLFLGHRDDVAALYDAFDLLVQSSEYEGTPNVVLEAMAMETPLVATDVGGTRELAVPGIHGLVVPPHDVAALRTAIEAAIADPASARARAAAARRRVETELSFATRTRRLEQVYEELGGPGRTRPLTPDASHA